ncbi:MAG: hypothetical protein IPJ24_15320 [bacterium]|nr:hypothetical protein [bacterium]
MRVMIAVDGRLQGRHQRRQVARQLASLYRRGHGTAALVPEHHDQPHAEVLGGVLDAGQPDLVGHVAGHAHHEQVAQALVEHHFGRHA